MPKILYVDMLDFSRIGLLQEPCGHRIVTVPLTPEQESLLAPRETGMSGGNIFHEEAIPVSIQEIDQ